MWSVSAGAALARSRLLDDQLLRPLAERRLALAVLSRRLERAGREALIGALAERVTTDLRYVPVLRKLLSPPA